MPEESPKAVCLKCPWEGTASDVRKKEERWESGYVEMKEVCPECGSPVHVYGRLSGPNAGQWADMLRR